MPEFELRAAVELARRQDDVLTRRQALAAGLTVAEVRGLADRGDWPRTFRGCLDVPPVRDPARARARAATLARPGSVIASISAARLHGLQGLRPFHPAETSYVLLPRPAGRHARPAMRTLRSELEPHEVVEVAGIPVTSVPRTLVDTLPVLSRERAVSLLDSALTRSLVNGGDLQAIADRIRRRGAGRTASWLSLADDRAESPLETRLRLALLDAGMSPPALQHVVRAPDSEIVLARIDLAWPSRRIAIEADGRGPHSAPEAVYGDRFRQNALVELGWQVLRFTWEDVTGRPDWIAASVRRVLARAA